MVAVQVLISPTVPENTGGARLRWRVEEELAGSVGGREKHWRQQTDTLEEANKKMLRSMVQKDKLLKELSDEVQLHRVKASTVQPHNNPEQPSQQTSAQPIISPTFFGRRV